MEKIGRCASWFVLQQSWRRYLVAFILGLLTALALPPVNLVFVPFFTLPCFVWLLDGLYGDHHTGLIKQVFAAFLPGWWLGFGYLLGGLWWIGSAVLIEAESFAWALPLAVIALPALLAIFWGIGSLIARLLWSDGWGRVLALAVGISIAEYLRGTVLTGFPWNAFGYLAMPIPVLMQSASVIGIYGMTTVAVVIFTLPAVGFLQSSNNQQGLRAAFRTMPVVLALGLLGLHLGFGMIRMWAHPPRYSDDSPLIRVMQPNISQKDKMARGNEASIIETYLAVSQQTGDRALQEPVPLDKVDYLIWPESAFPFLLTEQPTVLAAIADLLPEKTKLITGAMRAEPGSAGNPWGKVYNSVFVISAQGEFLAGSDKTHLVPFGEFLPFQSSLEGLGLRQLTRLRGGFEPGVQRKVLESKEDYPFLPLICYEIIFSGEIFDAVPEKSPRPKWIINLTNDAWFGRTPGPYLHLRQAQLRAIEEGLPVIRVANTGVSAVIDPLGRISKYLPLGMRGSFDSRVPVEMGSTYFVYFHSFGFTAVVLLCCVGSLIFRKNSAA